MKRHLRPLALLLKGQGAMPHYALPHSPASVVTSADAFLWVQIHMLRL